MPGRRIPARPGTLLLSSLANLGLGNTAHLLGPVLLLLPLLAATPGLSLDSTLPQQPVLGLELLGEVHGVVDEGEPSGLATTELCLEPEGEAAVGGAGVHLGQFFPVDRGLVGIAGGGRLGSIGTRSLLLLTPLRGAGNSNHK